MDLSHAITYAVFQAMVSLFMSSPLAKTTAEHDYISIQPKEMIRLLEQPKTAGIRYYFTRTPTEKMSAVIFALDSNGQENRTIVLNAKNRAEAERGIKAYADSKMDKITNILYGTIGIADVNGKWEIDQGKAELLQLAQNAKEIRVFYGMKEDAEKKQKVILCFTAPDKSGMVMQMSADKTTATILDASFECPPFCR
jgi:hypothetical protein